MLLMEKISVRPTFLFFFREYKMIDKIFISSTDGLWWSKSVKDKLFGKNMKLNTPLGAVGSRWAQEEIYKESKRSKKYAEIRCVIIASSVLVNSEALKRKIWVTKLHFWMNRSAPEEERSKLQMVVLCEWRCGVRYSKIQRKYDFDICCVE